MGCVRTEEEMPRKGRIHKKKEKREKVKNVAAKGSGTITSVFLRTSTPSTPSSPDQLIEDKIK